VFGSPAFSALDLLRTLAHAGRSDDGGQTLAAGMTLLRRVGDALAELVGAQTTSRPRQVPASEGRILWLTLAKTRRHLPAAAPS
jgi:hypothetical protein